MKLLLDDNHAKGTAPGHGVPLVSRTHGERL